MRPDSPQHPAGTIAAVVPCFRVADRVLDVIARMPPEVSRIYCIDDACPEGSGRLVEERCEDPRVEVVFHPVNLGVGGAVKTGYRRAQADGFAIAVKIDGDGQMDPALLPRFVRPILDGQADYTKGNRFYFPKDARSMPRYRLLGNAALSFVAKLSTGYWTLFDPTNGYTAMHLSLTELVPLDKVADRYFFETDLLFRLNVARCVVVDVPMTAHYAGEQSSLRVSRVIGPYLAGNIRNAAKRIFYGYFLRDFQVASIECLLGPLLLAIGVVYGGYHWWQALATGQPATAGTVMISGLSIILGVQFTLSALHFDLRNVPDRPVHPLLVRLSPASELGQRASIAEPVSPGGDEAAT